MMKSIIGKKIGMTTVFTENGEQVPCTVIEAGPCTVIQVKTRENDGYDAVQLGYGEIEERKVNKPLRGHFNKTKIKPTRVLKEVPLEKNADVKVGESVDVSLFAPGDIVSVTGISKGKGFQGVVKRHGFRGGVRTHGQSDRLRAPGSVGSSSFPSRVFKGLRMAGRTGGNTRTVRNLTVVKIMPESNLILIRGAVPGAENGLVVIKKL